ncbi:glycosyltransferase family 4 protein [Flavobacterium agrisoli]|uniref:Glycosyltransferase n=1 Tax=Flavobacterium agrisoli TaxID=2793066 RepID=A0A934PPW2_9FLAO|nr:glycosyltransferase [Flavobacterium agrisoli]MBK0370729.1 glycosyltransferase [Flavobacterium agrisoli]
MKFLIITHVHHKEKENHYFGYAPYVREMNIWLKFVDEVVVVGPLSGSDITPIDIAYKHDKIDFRAVPDFSFTNFRNTVSALGKMPILFWEIFWAMIKADHIHLRCPGNVGLIGCVLQILFPNKSKTAKYAGNWDPKSKQPWTYRFQKCILSNTFLTRNMQVLVYGEWPNQTQNIVPFFTASYSENEILPLQDLKVTDAMIRFVFAGTLVEGKNPHYAIQVVEAFSKKGYTVQLDVFGDGKLRTELERYVQKRQLQHFIFLHGNQFAEIVKKAYQNSHFVILPSKSEGWPKVLAEGMFWGCVPLATSVSCVPYMLGEGGRGVLLQSDITTDVQGIQTLLDNPTLYNQKRQKAVIWSRQFTLELFEAAIQKLV